MSDQSTKNPVNVAAGLKAALHNPNVSEDAKHNAQERLDNMQHDAGADEAASNMGHIIGGHKANIKNPNTSEEAKERSRDFLREHNVDLESEHAE